MSVKHCRSTLVLVALLAGTFRSHGFCTHEQSEYFASRITLTTAYYPEPSSLSHCSCVISVETESTLHVRLHVQADDVEATWCQPEIQFAFGEAMTSVCPTTMSNYSGYYEMRKGKQVKITVLNENEKYFKAIIAVKADGDKVIRVKCSEAAEILRLYPEIGKSSLSFQGAQAGLIAGGVIVFIVVLAVVITVTTRIGCTKLKTGITRETMATNVSATTEKKARGRSEATNKGNHLATYHTQCLSKTKTPSKSYLGSTCDDLDSRSYKGRDYYIDRGYRITITGANGVVGRWSDFDSVEESLGSRIPSRSPSFQYMDRSRITPKRSPSIHSNIETRSPYHLDNGTPRLSRTTMVHPGLLPRHPINLYRVNLPIRSEGSRTRHSAPSIAATGIKPPAAQLVEVDKAHKAPVFSLNDEDICFDEDTE